MDAHRLISMKPSSMTRTGQLRAISREGQQVKATDAAYRAGFLDGDGSLHFQLARQQEYKHGFYIRSSMSLSQSTSARQGLEYLQSLVGGGYLRDRQTGMSDLVITSRPLLSHILNAVEPYVVFKREHVDRALWLLPQIKPRVEAKFLRLAREVDAFSDPKLFEIEAHQRRRCGATSA